MIFDSDSVFLRPFALQESYSAQDLKGLTVQHKMESFKEGETLILTLEDKGLLLGGEHRR